MRLTVFTSAPVLSDVFVRSRSALDPWLARARKAGRHPKIAAAGADIAGAWEMLVESFCATIDPILSRLFRELRLVAVLTSSGEIELHRIVDGLPTPLGALAAIDPAQKAAIAQTKWTAIELRLRSENLLRRTLSLPAASRDFLTPIIDHRLERLTPWRPERVLYGYRMIGAADSGTGIKVALIATSKDFVAAPLQALSEAGLVATAVGSRDEPFEAPLRVNLMRGQATAARVDSRRLISRVALISFGILACAYLASSLWAEAAVDDQHQAGIRLIKARRLLKTASMSAIGDRERALIEGKRPDKAMVVLIDRLAKAIPDDTYLKELAVTPEKVRLVGISGNAPPLVSDLEAMGLANVRFTAAVTREKDQTDSFEITADRTAPAVADAP